MSSFRSWIWAGIAGSRLGRPAVSAYTALVELAGRIQDRSYLHDLIDFSQSADSTRHLARAPNSLVLAIGTLGPGGAERQLTLLASELRSVDPSLEVTVVCWNCNSSPDDFYRSALSEDVRIVDLSQVKIRAAAGNAAPQLGHWFNAQRDSYAKLCQVLRDLRPDIVHGWLDSTALVAGLAALRCGVPKIFLSTRNLSPHHFVFHQPWFRTTYRFLVGQANIKLLNNSLKGAEDYAHWLGMDPASIFTIYNGFHFDRLTMNREDAQAALKRELGFADQARIIGTVMRLAPEKDPDLWLACAAEVTHRVPEARFVMVGDGPMRDHVNSKIRQLGLQSVCRVLSATDQVFRVMSGFDLFFLASRHEGLPNVLIEAQALGVPVVTTRAGGAAEAVDDGISGVVLKSRTPKAIGPVLANLVVDGELCREMGNSAREFVISRFGFQRMITQHLNLYQM